MWLQLKDANWRVSYVGGWCLKYVQDAFGTDHPDPDALNAWNDNYGNGNHVSLPPAGKTVPVYFSLGNVPQGHVAISLDDGKVASSTQAGSHPAGYIHPNLNDLVATYGRYNGGCAYLGWSEYVGTVHVVKYSNPNASVDQIKQAFLEILERPADADAIAHYQNYTNDFMRADLSSSVEYHTLQGNKAATAQAIRDAIAQEAAAKAAAEAIAAKLQAEAEIARLAEVARLKAVQDAADAQAIIDVQLADAKAKADTEALQASDHSFILRLKNLLQTIIDFIKSLKG